MSWTEASVLVVDDNDANVALLRTLLASAGLTRVTCLTDPRQAVAQFSDVAPDVVLLDLHMPHLSGIDVMTALAPVIAGEFLPIVVLTADATPGARQQALQLGAKDFLTKPFDNEEVVLRVRNLIESRMLYVGLRSENAELAERVRIHDATDLARAHEQRQITERIQAALQPGAMTTVFQPIVDLDGDTLVGLEALTRFGLEPRRTPDVWFQEAARVGLGNELELAAVSSALRHLDRVPAPAFISINISPEVVLDERLAAAMADYDRSRLVLEITEHSQISDYAEIAAALHGLRASGVRIAVDDTGAGFAGLQQILHVRPELIKLDLDLTRGIDSDPVRRALAVALAHVAHELGASIVAEGIETATELRVLKQLEVMLGQGYFLGRPQPLEDIDFAAHPTRQLTPHGS